MLGNKKLSASLFLLDRLLFLENEFYLRFSKLREQATKSGSFSFARRRRQSSHSHQRSATRKVFEKCDRFVASKKICENNIMVFSDRQIQHLHICSVLFILAIQARRKCLFSRDFDSAAGAECVADGTVDDARPAHVHPVHFGAARDRRRLPPPARRRPDEQQAHQSGQRRAASDWGWQPVCKKQADGQVFYS